MNNKDRAELIAWTESFLWELEGADLLCKEAATLIVEHCIDRFLDSAYTVEQMHSEE